MTTTVICTDIRPVTENGDGCVIVAAAPGGGGGAGVIDPRAASSLPEIRDRLLAEGIVLGGPLQPAPTPNTQSHLTPPVEIIGHDEHGKEHRLSADRLEEYRLSSGSALYYLFVRQMACDCRWLLGQTLAVAEVSTRPPGVAERVHKTGGVRP
jgi:hypothetical protein